jgi:hypothetical protein
MVSAHDQLAVYEEGRGDGHPEADALVHVQLIYGLVGHTCKLTMHVAVQLADPFIIRASVSCGRNYPPRMGPLTAGCDPQMADRYERWYHAQADC